MKKKNVIHTLLASATLAFGSGCSTGKIYAPASENMWKLGYSETQLASSSWRVTYRGYDVAAAQAADFAFLRAAELCIANGFSHFTVDGETSGSTMGIGMAVPAAGAWLYSSADQPEVTITIRANSSGQGYDAKFVRDSIRTKHHVK